MIILLYRLFQGGYLSRTILEISLRVGISVIPLNVPPRCVLSDHSSQFTLTKSPGGNLSIRKLRGKSGLAITSQWFLAKLVFQLGHFVPKSFARFLYNTIMGVAKWEQDLWWLSLFCENVKWARFWLFPIKRPPNNLSTLVTPYYPRLTFRPFW